MTDDIQINFTLLTFILRDSFFKVKVYTFVTITLVNIKFVTINDSLLL